jgi:phosphatidylglycerol:prolipoprotein diacylglycerol transferase
MITAHLLSEVGAWLAALLTAWLMYRWRFRERIEGLTPQLGAGYFVALSLGGLLGAFAFGTLNAQLSGASGVGRSILGGLVTAILFIEVYKWQRGVRGSTGAVLAVPFALAIALGRLGCYQAGLDDFTYGTPTGGNWGVDFGDGILRHPVQLYETAAMGVTALGLILALQWRSQWVIDNGFYLAMGAYATQRFAWEFFKPYAPVLGPLNVFHLLCLLLFAYSAVMVYLGSRERT